MRISDWSSDVGSSDLQAALARAHELIARQVGELERQELLSDAAGAVSRIQTCAQLEDALEGVDYVQESLPEIVELKKEIFGRLDRLSPPAAEIGRAHV